MDFFIWHNFPCRSLPQNRLITYGLMALTVMVILTLFVSMVLFEDRLHADDTPGMRILRKAPVIDSNNGLFVELNELFSDHFWKDYNFTENSLLLKTDYPKLKAGMVGCQIFVARVRCNAVNPLEETMRLITRIRKFAHIYNLTLAESSTDIAEAFKTHTLAIMIGVDGGHSIMDDAELLSVYYDLGVRYITLSSSAPGDESCSTNLFQNFKDTTRSKMPDKAKNAIAEMNRLGMMIDLAGSSFSNREEVANISTAPVIYSTAGLFDLYENARNVKSDNVKQLGSNGGIIMTSFDADYIKLNGNVADVADHINLIKKIIGTRHVGIGAGFGSMVSYIKGLSDSSSYPALFDLLAQSTDESGKRIWSDNDLALLSNGNFFRVLKEVEAAAAAAAPKRKIKLNNEGPSDVR